MRRKLRRLGELVVLAATGLCLVGHGFNGSAPSCEEHEGQSARYNATGTCGPAGIVTLSQPDSICGLSVAGDSVGLPTSGYLGDEIGAGFTLYGTLDGDWSIVCTAQRSSPSDAGPTVPGQLSVSCTRNPSESNPSREMKPWCREDLVPVTQACDLGACPRPSCPRGQHPVLLSPSCCAGCTADTAADAVPDQPLDTCHPENCSTVCPAGQEINTDAGVCCGSCQTVPQSCLDGRATWRGEAATKWRAALACKVDEDCIATVVGSDCEVTCPDAIARDQIGAISAWAQARGKELCSTCFGQPTSRNCPAGLNLVPVCADGACQLKK